MTLDSRVRVRNGDHKGQIGWVIAICENSEYMVSFDKDDKNHGTWFKRHNLDDVTIA